MSSEIEVEPVPGLPERLPEGERILWQGKPDWKKLARHTFRLRLLGAYFAFFLVVRAALVHHEGQGVAGAAAIAFGLALSAACIGVLVLVAWMHARATVYTITTRRVVFRVGVALPTSFNLPFKALASADLKTRSETDGDIVLTIAGTDRIAWLHLWPHAQPWHFKKARPMMRAIAEPGHVAAVLADAVRAWAKAETMPVRVAARVVDQPMVVRTRSTELVAEAGQ